MKQEKATHIIEAKKQGSHWTKQPAIGKADLFNVLREMMKDGYIEFKITVLPVPEPVRANQFSS